LQQINGSPYLPFDFWMEAGMGRRDSVAQRNALISNVLYETGFEEMAGTQARTAMAKISDVSLEVAPSDSGQVFYFLSIASRQRQVMCRVSRVSSKGRKTGMDRCSKYDRTCSYTFRSPVKVV